MALTDPATLSPVDPSEPPARGALALSAAVICLNEAACIGKCLESLGDCAEIVVVDSGSTDATPAIVDDFIRRGFPIRFIHQPWLGYARQKQFALDQTKEPWIFSVDADEWLDEDLRASLPRLMTADESVAGWKVRRSLTLYGQAKPVSPWTRPEHILRLVRRGRARFDPALIVHERLVADHGETPIAHDGLLRHERSLPLNEQMKKEIVYARLKAEQRLKQGRKPSTLKLVFNPPIYFLRIFFWNRFFLSGWAGFIHAATGAVYSLMTEAIHRQLKRSVESQALRRRRAIGRGGMSGEFDDEALDALEVVIPNLNWRYSGGTAVNRTIAPLIAKRWRAAWFGPDRPEGIAGLSLSDLMRLRFRPPGHGRVRIWHARRNVEMLAGLFLNRFGYGFALIFNSASQREKTWLTHFLIGRMDAVIATSQIAAQFLRRPATVVLHGIDVDLYRPPDDRLAAFAGRGLPGKYGIGTFGRVRKQKGSDLFVEAMCRLLPQYPDFSAVVIGLVTVDNRPFLEGLKQRVAAAGLSERIQFLGELPIEKVPLWYQRISIYVFASRVEGFGLTMLEAMAAGDAVVATRAGAAEMIITDGDDGALAPVDDVEALVAALEPLMREPERIAAMGERARARVVSAFSRDREADEISAVYRQVWAARKTPS